MWCDVFAIMQHDPPGPEPAELDFAAVVTACSSLLLVGQHVPAVAQMDDDAVFSKRVPDEAKMKCAFFRVWCIVELEAALRAAIPVVMLVGSGEAQCDGSTVFRTERSMLPNLLWMVDVKQAAASRESDKTRILADVDNSPGGIKGVNSLGALHSPFCPQLRD